jgi:hypothetical protein
MSYGYSRQPHSYQRVKTGTKAAVPASGTRRLETADDWQGAAFAEPILPCPTCKGRSIVIYETTKHGKALVRTCINSHRVYLAKTERGNGTY